VGGGFGPPFLLWRQKMDKGQKKIAIRAQQLWQTVIFETDNPNHSKIKEDLINFAHEYRKGTKKDIESGVAPSIKRGLFESRFDFFDRFGEEEPIKSVVDFCHTSLKMAITALNEQAWSENTPKDANIIFDIHESWLHITKEGGYHEIHNHDNCTWCAVYYIDVGDSSKENGGLLRFYDPRWPTGLYTDYGNMYWTSKQIQTATPTDGKLIIFPSYLYHAITPLIKSTKERINFAMNVRVYNESEALAAIENFRQPGV